MGFPAQMATMVQVVATAVVLWPCHANALRYTDPDHGRPVVTRRINIKG